MSPLSREVRHASAVATAGRGLLIEGPAGSGKSALALELMAFGADLVADDRTELSRPGAETAEVWVDAPEQLPALIEARGLGLLPVRLAGPVPLFAVVRLGEAVPERLPAPVACELLGIEVACFALPPRPQAAALWQCLKSGALPQWA